MGQKCAGQTFPHQKRQEEGNATEKRLKIFEESPTILSDGTFKCCPPLYEQL